MFKTMRYLLEDLELMFRMPKIGDKVIIKNTKELTMPEEFINTTWIVNDVYTNQFSFEVANYTTVFGYLEDIKQGHLKVVRTRKFW